MSRGYFFSHLLCPISIYFVLFFSSRYGGSGSASTGRRDTGREAQASETEHVKRVRGAVRVFPWCMQVVRMSQRGHSCC